MAARVEFTSSDELLAETPHTHRWWRPSDDAEEAVVRLYDHARATTSDRPWLPASDAASLHVTVNGHVKGSILVNGPTSNVSIFVMGSGGVQGNVTLQSPSDQAKIYVYGPVGGQMQAGEGAKRILRPSDEARDVTWEEFM